MTSNAPTPQAYVVFLPDDPTANPYRFRLSEEAYVQDLEDQLYDHWAFKRTLENERVQLFKCGALDTEPPDCRDPAGERYKAAIKWLRAEDNIKTMRMDPLDPLKEHFPFGPASFEGNKIDVIVVVVPRPTMAGPDHECLSQRHVMKVPHANLVTFNIFRESYTAATPSWQSVLDRRVYVEELRLPVFIKDVVERPRRADHDDEDSAAQLLRYIETKCNTAISAINATTVLSNLCGDDGAALPYARGHPELFHYAAAFHYVNRRIIGKAPGAAVGDQLEFNEAYGLVFSFFQDYWEGEVANPSCTFGKQLPFPLIAREHVGVGFGVEDERALNYRKYQPQPDVAFLKGKCPRFLAQIDSLDNHYDKYRLYIQMACALKLALAFRPNPGKDDNFFLMGAFFAKEWEIHRIFFYTKDDKTCFHKRTYMMNDASQLMTFLYEFYNYARHVKDDDTVGDLTKTIADLAEGIKKAKLESLYSKQRTSSDAGSDDTSYDRTQRSDTHAAMTDALQKSHFQVQYLDEEFEPLHKLPDHVMEVISPDGKLVIAKLPCKHSNELSLLRELLSQRSPHNHVIPLLDTVPSSLGQLIILPYATSLSIYSIPSLFQGSFGGICVQLSRELIEGIAFLHRRKIAHLDIKPDNLVYAPDSKRLYIIDFDLALQCEDVDEMVEMSCGTPGWSAPEIDHDDSRPLSVFSSIRADLWSCGAVLCLFSENGEKKDMDIVRLATLLMDNDPRSRPLLHEVVDEDADFWTSGRLVQALDSRICDGKVQETTADGDGGLKRAHDDSDQASRLGSVSKVPKKDGNATIWSPSAASSSSSSCSFSDPSPDTSFDSLSSSSTLDPTVDCSPPPPNSGKVDGTVVYGMMY